MSSSMGWRSDDQELNEILSENEKNLAPPLKAREAVYDDSDTLYKKMPDFNGLCQWSTSDGIRYIATSKTVNKLKPGVYDILHSNAVGIFFEETPVLSMGLINFPQTNSNKVVEEIQKFWSREHIFRKYNLTYKRGIILWGPPGCHAAGTKVLMYDGTVKSVEDVVVGDFLIGPDSKSREVLQLRHGQDYMYRIIPVKGDSFIVNGHHILSLKRSKDKETNYPKILNCSVNDYMSLSKCAQRSFKLWHTAIEFNALENNILLDPYFLGLWLGDGHEGNTAISTADKEIKDFIFNFAKINSLNITEQKKTDSICSSYYLVGLGGKNTNPLRNVLKKLNVFNNKHIPQQYLTGSRATRLALLAGLIDTDGGYETASWRNREKFKKKGWKGTFNISQKRNLLSEQIVFLAKSLGFGVTSKKRYKTIKNIGFREEYNCICIFGNINEIPVKIARKKALKGLPNKDPLRTGIKSIESLGVGNYYGFTLSDDHLYLTNDFFVHHNSGKSCTIQLIMRDVVDRGGVVIKFTNPSLFMEGIRKFREIQPDTEIVILMEDIDSILSMYNESEVLNILDGVNQIEKVVFLATTNYPEKLGARIINRPSRFDKRFRIGNPNAESRKLYLEYIIGKENIVNLKIDLDQWVKDTENFSIAHLKELFTAVIILDDSYDDAIKCLSLMKENKPDSIDDEECKKKISNLGFGAKIAGDIETKWR